ncbi:MAG: DUF211 domain-containing protein [Thermoproteota archaeon]
MPVTVTVRRLLLDSLKPRELSLIELSKALASVNGVEEVGVVVIEVDSKTETLKVTIEGPEIDHEAIWKVMENYGVSIKGVDEISAAKQ